MEFDSPVSVGCKTKLYALALKQFSVSRQSTGARTAGLGADGKISLGGDSVLLLLDLSSTSSSTLVSRTICRFPSCATFSSSVSRRERCFQFSCRHFRRASALL